MSGSTAVAALVGTRIYRTVPEDSPQPPFLVVTVTGAEPLLTLDGPADTTR